MDWSPAPGLWEEETNIQGIMSSNRCTAATKDF